jgi:hypothetical protein
MSLWLTPSELVELTGKKQRRKQIEVLTKLRPAVRFRVRPEDSFPLVDRDQFTGGLTEKSRRREPNWTSATRN